MVNSFRSYKAGHPT